MPPHSGMFSWFRALLPPHQDLDEALEARLSLLERRSLELRADMAAWEARAAKLTRELSRTLKALAEIERREQLKADVDDDLDLGELEEEDQDQDLLSRTLRFANGQSR